MSSLKNMQPTFRLRWLAKSNVVTAQEVQAYREEHGVGMLEAKKCFRTANQPYCSSGIKTEPIVKQASGVKSTLWSNPVH